MYKKLTLATASVLLSLNAHSAVFVAAHPDDIELFMGTNVAVDLADRAPTVFIVLSAGDAGAGRTANTQGYGSNSKGIGYASVRVSAHISAIRFAMNQSGTNAPAPVDISEVVAGKKLTVTTIGNVKFYNLMLPDGNFDGNGFSGTGNQSMQKLHSKAIATITSYDSASNTYTLPQLKSVIASIVTTNMKGIPSVWVNVQDDNSSGKNPNDHSDHTFGSKLVQDALTPYTCIKIAHFVDYEIKNMPTNLSIKEISDKSAMWGVLNASLTANGNPSTYNDGHNGWLDKQYFSTTQGNGACNF